MVGLKWVIVKLERKERQRKRLPVGLAAAAAVDTLVDSAIISTGFSIDAQLGALLAVVLSFGAATLIYLIAEELLVETIQAEESIFSTVTLFSGFLVLLALKIFS